MEMLMQSETDAREAFARAEAMENAMRGDLPKGVDRSHPNYSDAPRPTTRALTRQPRMSRRDLRAWAAKTGNRAPSLADGLRRQQAEKRLAEMRAKAERRARAGK